MRELHVYGPLVDVVQPQAREWQHRGYGEELLAEATERAEQAGFSKLAVISRIGVRPYYRKLGFERDGPYMSRFIYVGLLNNNWSYLGIYVNILRQEIAGQDGKPGETF